MAITTDKPRTYMVNAQDYEAIPVAAATVIPEGAAVSIDGSGNAVNATGTSGFAGFARRMCDNSAGAAGAKTVVVWTKGKVVVGISDTIALTDRGGTIEMSDNDTFHLAAAITGLPVGKLQRITTPGASGSNEAVLIFEADSERSL